MIETRNDNIQLIREKSRHVFHLLNLVENTSGNDRFVTILKVLEVVWENRIMFRKYPIFRKVVLIKRAEFLENIKIYNPKDKNVIRMKKILKLLKNF